MSFRNRRQQKMLQRMVPQNVVPIPAAEQDVVLTDRAIPPRIMDPMPDAYDAGPEAIVNGFLPPWNMPAFRSSPIDVESEFITLDFYLRQYTILELPIIEGNLGIITGISYECTCMAQYDMFEFSVYRDGDQLSFWQDILIDPANPNPAYKFALAGHVRRLPYYARIDSGQTLYVRVRALGQEPFTKTGADPLLCAVRVCLHGWETQLDSVREGKGRVDQNGQLMEYPRQYANPDMDPMRNLYWEIPRSLFRA